MRLGNPAHASRVALAAVTLAISVAGLAGCTATASSENTVASDQRAVAAVESTPSPTLRGPDTLVIANDRLETLLAEQRAITADRTRVLGLISTLKASSSCKNQSKTCDKKLSMLADERDRLEVRIEQLPRSIDAVRAAIVQRQPN